MRTEHVPCGITLQISLGYIATKIPGFVDNLVMSLKI